MKLKPEDLKKIKDAWGDWENVHGIFDDLARARLKELDEEYYNDLNKAIKGATFWYA